MITRSAIALSIALLIGPLLVGQAIAQPAARPDLTLQARAVLRKFCVDCHRTGATQKGELSVLDSAGLAPAGRGDRPFLTAKSADTSQLLRLIEDGSMPPGNHPKPTEAERRIVREWIAAGAANYPEQYDDAYVHNAILADISALPEDQRRTARYISMHHAVADVDPTLQLESKRQAVRDAVASLAKDPKQLGLASVDPAQLVFRVDIKQPGWDLKPFRRMHYENGKEVYEDSNVNLFDLILIEYPFASLADSEVFRQLGERYLRVASQALPISFLRADWFVDDFARSDVAREIRVALFDPERLKAQGTAPLAREPVFPKPGARPAGTPIIPLDSITQRDYMPDPPPFDLVFETIDAKTKARRSDFVEEEKMAFRVRATKPVYVEVAWTDAVGKCEVPDLNGHANVKANEDTHFLGQKDEGYELVYAGAGIEYLTIFVSESKFPPGQMLKVKGQPNERVLHAFYPLPGTKPEGYDPARIVKKTIRIKIKPK